MGFFLSWLPLITHTHKEEPNNRLYIKMDDVTAPHKWSDIQSMSPTNTTLYIYKYFWTQVMGTWRKRFCQQTHEETCSLIKEKLFLSMFLLLVILKKTYLITKWQSLSSLSNSSTPLPLVSSRTQDIRHSYPLESQFIYLLFFYFSISVFFQILSK